MLKDSFENSEKIYEEMYKASLSKDNYLLNDIEEKNRGIGKSYNIVKLAIKEGLPIFCGCQSTKQYLEDLAKKEFNKEVEVVSFISTEDFRGCRIPEIILTEGLPLSIIFEEFINKGTIVIGTHRG